MIPTNSIRANWGRLREPRQGIMLHYDDSGSDKGALEWLTADPRCAVSYNILVLDNGTAYIIAPLAFRAWHAGVCMPSNSIRLNYVDANSAFYGVAIAAKPGDVVSDAQFEGVIAVCRELAATHGWDLGAEPWRLTGHENEAWGRGRKSDPTGPDGARPVLSLAAVQAAFHLPLKAA